MAKRALKKVNKKSVKKTSKKAAKKSPAKPVKKIIKNTTKKAVKKAIKKATPPVTAAVHAAAVDVMPAATLMTAVLTVDIRNTNPGLSSVTATSDTASRTINSGGIITLHNIKSGEMIVITGRSLGTTTISINLSADPVQLNFPPGQLQGSFFIN